MPAPILVMLIIIVLNVSLLVIVMRVGTQDDHHSEFAADQSLAVAALRSRLAVANPAVEAVAEAPVVEEAAEETSDQSE